MRQCECKSSKFHRRPAVQYADNYFTRMAVIVLHLLRLRRKYGKRWVIREVFVQWAERIRFGEWFIGSPSVFLWKRTWIAELRILKYHWLINYDGSTIYWPRRIYGTSNSSERVLLYEGHYFYCHCRPSKQGFLVFILCFLGLLESKMVMIHFRQLIL